MRRQEGGCGAHRASGGDVLDRARVVPGGPSTLVRIENVDELRAHTCQPLFDRAGQFTRSCDAVLASAGIEAVKIRAEVLARNAYAERFVLTARTVVTDRMLISVNDTSGRSSPSTPAITTDDGPIAAGSCTRPGRTTRMPLSPTGGSSADPSSVLINEYERAARRPGQDS